MIRRRQWGMSESNGKIMEAGVGIHLAVQWETSNGSLVALMAGGQTRQSSWSSNEMDETTRGWLLDLIQLHCGDCNPSLGVELT